MHGSKKTILVSLCICPDWDLARSLMCSYSVSVCQNTSSLLYMLFFYALLIFSFVQGASDWGKCHTHTNEYTQHPRQESDSMKGEWKKGTARKPFDQETIIVLVNQSIFHALIFKCLYNSKQQPSKWEETDIERERESSKPRRCSTGGWIALDERRVNGIDC